MPAEKAVDRAGRVAVEAPVGFQDLPPELHLLVSQQLIYPDALSLKHTNRYFHSLVDTGLKLKVDWLIERRNLHLECPNDRCCDLGSDLKFCRGSVSDGVSTSNANLVQAWVVSSTARVGAHISSISPRASSDGFDPTFRDLGYTLGSFLFLLSLSRA
ncbi:hypothetical protein GGR52DRAFT_147717 [Hypoxylon sp. FL1284]|nr:hypothetical protein GGR52DRAFT_147717 [Hypoxylon sp. FL1284]